MLVCLGLFTTSASAKPGNSKKPTHGLGIEDHSHPGKGNKKPKPEKAEKAKNNRKPNQFSDKEREQIAAIFRGKDGSHQLPPGLAMNLKRGKPLPPGWQKKLNTGSVLDRGILDGLTPISYDLIPGLKPVAETQLYYHDNRIVRVANATREILDVITLP